MTKREIKPLKGPIEALVKVPGSKSITQRALICAALAEGESILEDALRSEDPDLLAQALAATGVRVEFSETALKIGGIGGSPRLSGKEIFMGNNGTGARFFLAYASLGKGTPIVLTGTKRLCERPFKSLIEALRAWGASLSCLEKEGFLPIKIAGGGLSGGEVSLSVSESSQFLSALLLVGPYTREPAVIKLSSPLVSRPYVDLTLAVMEIFGAEVEEREETFLVHQQKYQARHYQIEADASSASYFLAAAALVGGQVTVANLPKDSLQGDAAFAGILSRMGCEVTYDKGVTVTRDPKISLRGIDINMGRYPDLVPTLAVVAAKAKGKTIIRGVPHLRFKETDRLKAVATELRKCEVPVEELEDGLIIEGTDNIKGAEIETYDDHRIAMAFAILGLVVEGMVILNPGCVAKSFPNFWEILGTLYA
ncbi:3-phosphoshikimate 1-carboxyvinyltransferase [Thermodesulfatator indicus DSM 15286]|uniref:3-phosphoshikimate 1-carboxyvinyltransferase n=1 Tax=Thermodesulfatator indicus (strain DSM 15286 / JCM 11887 / CIR29812) TaxID=667014 RepID=F8ACD7_THEID|nr:3-phosphoshikimate 1-carboxyvinyltransferase [Thermodesulfatator indicus]AEH45777.1 3-phosphoshikimate 1-carboxyvinyltransferase [Thermodesulfatator indicus DSM 15286]